MRRVLIGALAVAASAVVGSAALASTPVSLSPQASLDGQNSVWIVSSTASISGAGTPNGCLSTPDAFGGAVDAATTSPPSGDAFDGGMMLQVGGVGFTDADNTGTTNGTDTITAGPTTMSGLDVGVKETALSTSQTLRMLVSLKNTSSAQVDATVALDSALGDSAPSEVIDATSNGDTAFSPSDRWIITTDTHTDATPTLVFFGKGKGTTRVAAVTRQPTVTACTTVELNVSVPASSTRYLMFFAQVHANGTNQAAELDAQVFNSVTNTSPLMAGIRPKVQGRILNWKL